MKLNVSLTEQHCSREIGVLARPNSLNAKRTIYISYFFIVLGTFGNYYSKYLRCMQHKGSCAELFQMVFVMQATKILSCKLFQLADRWKMNFHYETNKRQCILRLSMSNVGLQT